MASKGQWWKFELLVESLLWYPKYDHCPQHTIWLKNISSKIILISSNTWKMMTIFTVAFVFSSGVCWYHVFNHWTVNSEDWKLFQIRSDHVLYPIKYFIFTLHCPEIREQEFSWNNIFFLKALHLCVVNLAPCFDLQTISKRNRKQFIIC